MEKINNKLVRLIRMSNYEQTYHKACFFKELPIIFEYKVGLGQG